MLLVAGEDEDRDQRGFLEGALLVIVAVAIGKIGWLMTGVEGFALNYDF
jgi:hypothetical protein